MGAESPPTEAHLFIIIFSPLLWSSSFLHSFHFHRQKSSSPGAAASAAASAVSRPQYVNAPSALLPSTAFPTERTEEGEWRGEERDQRHTYKHPLC